MPGPDREERGGATDVARRAGVVARDPAFTAVVAFLAFLLFCWPLARTPRLHVVDAWFHLTGAWLLLLVALRWLSRARRGEPPHDEREA